MKTGIPFTVKCEFRGDNRRYQCEYWSWRSVPLGIRNACRDVMLLRLDEATEAAARS